MNRKAAAFIIALPALLLIFVFKIGPAVTTFILSMKDYTVTRGIMGSPAAGMKNYSMLFQLGDFARVFRNTIFLNVFSIALTCFFSALLIMCISRMPGRLWKLGAIIIVSIPAFMPIASFMTVFMGALSVNTGIVNYVLIQFGMQPRLFFGETALYPLLFALTDSLRNVYIPVIIGVLALEGKKVNGAGRMPLVLAGYAAARATMLLSPDIENILLSYNPLVYANADVLDAFSFRSGLQQMQFGTGSAAWVIKIIVQLFISIIAYFILSAVLPRLSEFAGHLLNEVRRGLDSVLAILGFILLAAGSIAMIILIFIPSAGSITEGLKVLSDGRGISFVFANSLIYCVFSCVLYGFITLTLAYPLTAKTRLYPLLLIITASLANNFMGEYLMFKSLGMIDTAFPVILGPGLSVIGAFAMHFAVSGKFKEQMPGFGEYIRTAALPLLAVVLLSFIANWGSYIYQMIYINNPNLYGVGIAGRQLILSQGTIAPLVSKDQPLILEDVRAAFVFLSSLVPVLIGAAIICLHRFFPLAAFSAQIRKN